MRTTAQVAESVPGGQVTSVTIWRWCRHGLLGRDGQRLRLQHVRAGRKILIPDGALETFFGELAAADLAYFTAQEGGK